MEGEIRGKHLQRRAYVYVRQSSPAQVLNHQESSKRQYQLQKRAFHLGWPKCQIEVIDEDQGQSGASADNRKGFQRLISEVALGEVGAVFGLEISRLARSCADWYRLMEVAALASTLIIDEEGVYDPNRYNDRLLLGLKATLSEAELHFLKQRMVGGRRQKAQRGEYRIPLPAGYIWQEAIRMDPDERVRNTLAFFFSCFERLGTAIGVARYFETQRQLFPRRDGWGNGETPVHWVPLSISRALEILKNPTYAGVYSYDRNNPEKMGEGAPFVGGKVWILDAHPGYITLEQYEKNNRRLQENRSHLRGMPGKGSAREGMSLLQGICVCGVCGRRMAVSYGKDAHSYYCKKQTTGRICQWVRGDHIDKSIEVAVLETITHEEMNVATKVFEKIAHRAKELDTQWQKRIEAARYEADKAARRYYQVEPENRLVARTLERDWNERLAEAESLEEEYQKVRASQPFTLPEEQKQRILDLAQDIPRLWAEPTTQPRQRKQLVRLLIEDVTLQAIDEPWAVKVMVQWKTGATSNHMAQRACPTTTPVKTLDRIKELITTRTDREIAEILNTEGYHSATGIVFTEKMVSSIRNRRGWTKDMPNSVEAVERLKALNTTYSDGEIAQILNREGYRSATGREFTAKIVSALREYNELKKPWHGNSKKMAGRIRELFHDLTDQEIANKLNEEGYCNGKGQLFTAAGVASIRWRSGILRPRRGRTH